MDDVLRPVDLARRPVGGPLSSFNPCRKAAMWCSKPSSEAGCSNPITGIADCCAPAAAVLSPDIKASLGSTATRIAGTSAAPLRRAKGPLFQCCSE